MTYTAVPLPPSISAPEPTVSLRVVRVVPPTLQQISDNYGQVYPVGLVLSRALTYHEDLLLRENELPNAWQPAGEYVVAFAGAPSTIQADVFQKGLSDLERAAKMRHDNELYRLQIYKAAADEANAALKADREGPTTDPEEGDA